MEDTPAEDLPAAGVQIRVGLEPDDRWHPPGNLVPLGRFRKISCDFSYVPSIREAPVRFGYGLGMERFKRFRFSVLAVPLQNGFSVFQCSSTGKDSSGSGFGSWKTVPAVPVPFSVSGKTVLTVLVSGSGSVPEPPCSIRRASCQSILLLNLEDL